MPLDEGCPGEADYQYAKKSLALTGLWLERCISRFKNTDPEYGYSQSLFPIVQGCVYTDLRRQSALQVTEYEADGYAIGGLAVGEPTETMYEMIEVVNDLLPDDKPRYLMVVGTPANLLEAIERGVDMFDCIIPTRNGRNGQLFTLNGTMNMRNRKWADDFSPVDEQGYSFVDTFYSKAYLHHLFKAEEIVALQIASLHNLAFYTGLMNEVRQHIMTGDFSQWKRKILPDLINRL
jgi:queuine tRNA-ribosyltransferase